MVTTVQTIAGIALAAALSQSSLAAQIYASPQTNGSGNFTVFDTVTGTETVLGTTLGNMGLSFDSANTLYGVKQNALYTVDTTNGNTTLVGNNTAGGFIEASTFSLDGRLIASTSGSPTLYEISTVDGSSTSLGALTGIGDIDGLSVAPVAVNTANGVAAAGTVFAIDSGTLYTIDLGTLTATVLFNSVAANETIAFGADGTLYGNNSGGYSSIDLLTGTGTSLGGTGAWGSAVFGALAGTSAPVPAPAPLALMLLGAGLAAGGVRRRGK